MKDYIVYMDESIKKGEYFSNFYGGALIEFKNLEIINYKLNKTKEELGLKGEIKWSKVSSGQYLDKYMQIMNLFLNFVDNNYIKLRIMFTQNKFKPNDLTKLQYENEYHLLYYQFVKHAFGFQYSDDKLINLRLYFDKLPDTHEKNNNFKEFIHGLPTSEDWRDKDIIIKRENIVEIDSKKHVVQQCMDIVLGSMQFKLNKKHKYIAPGQFRRGKKTVAKEKLYKHIRKKVNEIYINHNGGKSKAFNIGVSTSIHGELKNSWRYPYMHWLFKSN